MKKIFWLGISTALFLWGVVEPAVASCKNVQMHFSSYNATAALKERRAVYFKIENRSKKAVLVPGQKSSTGPFQIEFPSAQWQVMDVDQRWDDVLPLLAGTYILGPDWLSIKPGRTATVKVIMFTNHFPERMARANRTIEARLSVTTKDETCRLESGPIKLFY